MLCGNELGILLSLADVGSVPGKGDLEIMGADQFVQLGYLFSFEVIQGELQSVPLLVDGLQLEGVCFLRIIDLSPDIFLVDSLGVIEHAFPFLHLDIVLVFDLCDLAAIQSLRPAFDNL